MRVKVGVRVRPLSTSECDQGHMGVIKCEKGKNIILREVAHSFDHVFDERKTQGDIYATLVKPLIKHVVNGFNATVFAYGQTGSGKTYTMGNAMGADGDMPSEGIIPAAVDDIFSHMEASIGNASFQLSLSFMEVYMEECFDLLQVCVRRTFSSF
jgi:hypothetical protein